MSERVAIHTSLTSPIRAFDFAPEDFAALEARRPDWAFVHHGRPRGLKAALADAEVVLSWVFNADWYALAPKLRAVWTPAAGRDWVAADPSGRVPTHFGHFHGAMIAESMLGMMLHFNRRVPEMLANERAREWDRNLQFPGRMLRSQRALIIGYGHIGRHCAKLLTGLGMEVAGCQRSVVSGIDPESGARYVRPDRLDEELAEADHTILLLPGGDDTGKFLGAERMAAMKPGSFVYNFGRGTTIDEDALVAALDSGRIRGAGLDVTGVEPLPEDSPLWAHERALVMPHSSCIYEEYRGLYLGEVELELAADLR